MTVIVFGDSITNRANDNVGGGWTSRLWSKIYEEFPENYAPGVTCSKHSVVELGIGGDTILGVEKRFESELKTRANPNNEGDFSEVVVGIAVGVNDSRIIGNTNIEFVSIKDYRQSYSRVLERLNRFGVTPFVVGLTPCDEEKVNPCLWIDTKDCYTNNSISIFNEAAKEIAKENGVEFVELLLPFNEVIVKEGPDSLLSDGVHPNARGHELIADSVFNAIKSKL